MKTEHLVSAFEAVLYASGEPMSIERFSQVFEISPEKTVEIMEKLAEKMKKNGSGLELLRLENTYQLSTKNEYAEYIKKAFDMRRRTPLSPAALEVLAVVAYNQPVTKSFIEQVRGVDCSGVVSTLVEKELIEERGRLELPGRPLLYGTTSTFLRSFSLSSLDKLPELPKDVAPDAKQLTFDDLIESQQENVENSETTEEAGNNEE
jgi:segregation and condensation protein B